MAEIKKFDVNVKPLSKAKPCIAMLMRDDGSIDWFEGCKAGQLLEIKSGMQKAYINLDYNKILNFNVKTDPTKLSEAQDHIAKVFEDLEKQNEEVEKLREKEEREYLKLYEQKDVKDIDNKKQKVKNKYEKNVEKLTEKYVKLKKNKIKNLGSESKPILGFVCYEKEFNALPYKPEHDSKAITQWMDDILKNKKDFQAQRTEAFGKVALYILLGLGLVAFVTFRYGEGFFGKDETEVVASTVAQIPMMLPILTKRGKRWLKEKLNQ